VDCKSFIPGSNPGGASGISHCGTRERLQPIGWRLLSLDKYPASICPGLGAMRRWRCAIYRPRVARCLPGSQPPGR